MVMYIIYVGRFLFVFLFTNYELVHSVYMYNVHTLIEQCGTSKNDYYSFEMYHIGTYNII